MKKVNIIDFACGIGGSLGWAKSVFGWETYLGIDNTQGVIDEAVGFGYDRENFIVADLRTYDISDLPRCRYVLMHHFLEHLTSEEEVEMVIKKAIALADDFVFIKHPFFDKDDYLKSIGFKITWSDWKGVHDCKVTMAMLERILDKTGLQYKLGYSYPIEDSMNDLILPYDAEHGSIAYRKEYGKKKYVKLKDVYHETYAFINVNCNYWEELLKTDIL